MMDQRPIYEKPLQALTIATVAAFVLYGLLLTCFQLLPFWIDEWLLIDNLKFKSAARLWGHLDRTQQFPRVYLEIIKAFSASCDYSYTSLRLPSFLAHCAGLTLLYKLSGRLFWKNDLSRLLWIMIYVSFSTSIHYFVQLKQYTMEMALSLVGIWQLLRLLEAERAPVSRSAWLLLCMSFAVCPFFSYTYPIVVAPVYAITGFRMLRSGRRRAAAWVPLLIGIAAILVCYKLDTAQVLADGGMQDFWKDLMMKTFSLKMLFGSTYMMFCNLGSGDLFGNIFGVLGVAAFLFSSYAAVRAILPARVRREKTSAEHHRRSGFPQIRIADHGSVNDCVLLYGCLLIWLVLALFIAGKLPLGAFRLNAFVVPAVGYMIVNMLRRSGSIKRWKPVAAGVAILLLLASIGNVYATMAELAGAEHARKLRIYKATDRAILSARRQHLPVLVTSAIAFPFEDRWPGDWILKTHPRYKTYEPLQVIAIPRAGDAAQYRQALPAPATAAIILDGDSVRAIRL